MKIKTSELIGPALRWAVMKSGGPDSFAAVMYYEGDTPVCVDDQPDTPSEWRPDEDWSQGGPIIELKIATIERFSDSLWEATAFTKNAQDFVQSGPTPLIAAMRCFVASKLGDEVDVPEELLS